ncbi:MAG TPA: hypothetical protein VGC17_05875 [Lactovum miscens]
MTYTVTQLRLALPVPSFRYSLSQRGNLSNYRLVTIDQRFITETLAATGSEELLTKASRNFIGLKALLQTFRARLNPPLTNHGTLQLKNPSRNLKTLSLHPNNRQE